VTLPFNFRFLTASKLASSIKEIPLQETPEPKPKRHRSSSAARKRIAPLLRDTKTISVAGNARAENTVRLINIWRWLKHSASPLDIFFIYSKQNNQ
jgi:hypothetical protein